MIFCWINLVALNAQAETVYYALDNVILDDGTQMTGIFWFFYDFYGDKGNRLRDEGFECPLQCAEGATQFSLGRSPRGHGEKEDLSCRDNTVKGLCCPYRTSFR